MAREYSKFKVNNCIYVCWTTKTYNGFAHTCKVIDADKNIELATAKVNYLNRTWESYRYQTVMKRAQDRLHDASWNASEYPIFDFDKKQPKEIYDN